MTTRWKLAASVHFLVLFVGSTLAVGDTVQLTPSKDNTLYQDSEGAVSNGQGQHFFAGTTAAGEVRRGLIAFDIAGNVPAGSTIQSVVLTLHVSRSRPDEVEIDLRAALQDWGEGASMAEGEEGQGGPAQQDDATWLNTFFDTQLWDNEGGDFASTVSGNAAVSEVGYYSFDSFFYPAMTSDVQQWLDQPETNFGWIVLGADESLMMSAKRFDSRDNSDPAVWPTLSVTYLPASP